MLGGVKEEAVGEEGGEGGVEDKKEISLREMTTRELSFIAKDMVVYVINLCISKIIVN